MTALWLGLSASSGWDLRRELDRLLREPDSPGRAAFVRWVEMLLAEREAVTARLRRELRERGAA